MAGGGLRGRAAAAGAAAGAVHAGALEGQEGMLVILFYYILTLNVFTEDF